MAGLPKVVSWRMRQQVPGPHLDPDLLTAFVEQRLRDSERTAVLAHLGTCAECREVVHLAAPPVSVESSAILARSERKFRVWQWSAVAASMAVVGIAVWMSAPMALRKSASQPLASVTEGASPKGPSSPAEEHETELRREREQAPAELDPAAASARPGKTPQTVVDEKNSRKTPGDYLASPKSRELGYANSAAVAGGRGVGTKASDLPRQDQKADVQGKIALAPASPSSVERPRYEAKPETSGETANAPAASGTDTRLISTNQIVAGQQPSRMETKDKETADTSTQVQKQNEPAAVAAVSMGQASKKLTKSKPAVTYTFFPAVRLSGDGMLQQQELGQNDRWRDLKVGSGEPLRALALRGNEIWVGGDKGALYRSSDGGKTWRAVDLKLPDQVGVVTLKFRDLLHGELTTTSGETWVSEDGGVSWQNVADENK